MEVATQILTWSVKLILIRNGLTLIDDPQYSKSLPTPGSGRSSSGRLTRRKRPRCPSCGRTWPVSPPGWCSAAGRECCSPDPSRTCSGIHLRRKKQAIVTTGSALVNIHISSLWREITSFPWYFLEDFFHRSTICQTCTINDQCCGSSNVGSRTRKEFYLVLWLSVKTYMHLFCLWLLNSVHVRKRTENSDETDVVFLFFLSLNSHREKSDCFLNLFSNLLRPSDNKSTTSNSAVPFYNKDDDKEHIPKKKK